MADAVRTYWLTTPCRIRRQDQSLRIEREAGDVIHIPITDVRDIVALAPVDLNTAVVSLLAKYQIDIHLLNYYGDYAGSVLTAESQTSGETVLAQAALATDTTARQQIARALVDACAFNVRRVVDRKLLDRPYRVLAAAVAEAEDRHQLMGIEGNFRRTAWEVLDTKLPKWLRLGGRTRRPPRNAGNAFISYVNGIIYARMLTAIRLTPLHSGISFLHSSLERQRHALALDLAEVFKPLFAERLYFVWPTGTNSNSTTSTPTSTKPCSAPMAASLSYKRSVTSWPPPCFTAAWVDRSPTTNCCIWKP